MFFKNKEYKANNFFIWTDMSLKSSYSSLELYITYIITYLRDIYFFYFSSFRSSEIFLLKWNSTYLGSIIGFASGGALVQALSFERAATLLGISLIG